MAKRKQLSPEEKHQKMMEKCKVFYEKYKNELQLNGDEIDQIHQLVDAGNELQGQICTEADKVNLDGFDKAKNLLTIDKATWGEFVKIVAKKLYGRLSEKALDKLNNSIELKHYLANLRQTFLESYLADEKMKVVDESGDSDVNFDESENSDFQNLLEEYAKIRDYINNVLYKRYNELAMAAYFITNGKIKRAEFKDLVDWEHYKDSEDPKYPSRSWKIYDRFNRMVRLMNEYEFNQIKDLNYEFGIYPEISTPHPITHGWQVEDLDE